MKKRCLKIKASAIVLMLFLVLTSIPMIALADTTTTGNNVRISGQDRYGTSFAVADELHKQTGAFDNVVVAFGGNFPDALSGGYLSKVKDAPLILIDPNQESKVLSYIKRNMKSNGTVYLLGGTGVVRSNFEAALKSQGNKVKRLAGQGRYDTNLEILKEAVKPGEEILVASGANYPDSLSGSAVGKGMLLVGKTLTDAQKNWIKSNNMKKFYILGGDAAVSPAVESELKTMGTVERIGGANRYDTSRKVADRFFPKAKKVALVSGKNFPDGLSGAPIAMINNAPIVLVADGSSNYAKDYVVRNEVTTSITIGGTGAVSVTIVNNVMIYVAPAKPEEPKPDEPTPTPEPTPEPEPEHTTHSWGEWEGTGALGHVVVYQRKCTICDMEEIVGADIGSYPETAKRIQKSCKVLRPGDYYYNYLKGNIYSGSGNISIYVDGVFKGNSQIDIEAEPGLHTVNVYLDGTLLYTEEENVLEKHIHDWNERWVVKTENGLDYIRQICYACGLDETITVPHEHQWEETEVETIYHDAEWYSVEETDYDNYIVTYDCECGYRSGPFYTTREVLEKKNAVNWLENEMGEHNFEFAFGVPMIKDEHGFWLPEDFVNHYPEGDWKNHNYSRYLNWNYGTKETMRKSLEAYEETIHHLSCPMCGATDQRRVIESEPAYQG